MATLRRGTLCASATAGPLCAAAAALPSSLLPLPSPVRRSRGGGSLAAVTVVAAWVVEVL
eukprot:SAG11_NODE_7452_length_1142_cov_1.016299_3_plen_59_part_01